MADGFNRIFVLYPRGAQTGGPEALHQIVDALRRQGHDASLVPLKSTAGVPRASAYERYDAPESELIDDPANAVIVPEGMLEHLPQVRRAQRICWWLSIDNSAPFLPRQEARDRRFTRSIGAPHADWSPNAASFTYRRMVARRPWRSLLESSLHLAQSAYARAYLLSSLGVSAAVVSDYLPLERPAPGALAPAGTRGRSIAYNPRKAPWVPELLGPRISDVDWRPLAGLTSTGVADLLSRTAVYFDPGFHPGRDRMPREAAVHGAVTVVARRGSGAFWDDVPIPWEHKVSPGPAFLEDTAATLTGVFEAPEASVAAQQGYRDWIADDRARFDLELERVFTGQRWEDDTPLLPPPA